MLGLKRDLWLLFSLNLAIGFCNQFIPPLFPLFLVDLRASEMQVGMIISLASVVSTSLMIPSGFLMDRIGKKKMLLISVIMASLPPLFIALTNDLKMVIPLYVVFNASFSLFIIARMAMIAESTTPANRATVFGFMNIAWPIGGIIAPALSGYIVENFSWSLIFLAASLIMALSLCPTLKLREHEASQSKLPEPLTRRPFMDRRFLPFMAVVFVFHSLMGTVEGATYTILPLYLKNQIRISTYLIGLFFTVSSVFTLFIQIPSGWLADRYGRKKILVSCLLPIPILFGLWLLTDNWMILITSYSAIVGLWSMTWPSSVALLSGYIPTEYIGSALGIRMTSIRLGHTMGPLIAVTMYSFFGYRSPFLVFTIFILAAIISALLIRETPERETTR